MKQNLLKLFGCVAVVSVFFSACIKDNDVELTTQGATLVKLLEAPENNMFFAPFSDVKTIDLFSVRKDAATSKDLQTPSPVKVTLVPDYIDTYNDDNGTTFELLPDSLFTTDVAKSGDIYDMSLAAGQASREFTIKLNGAKWDVAHTYAMAFALSDPGGNTISSGKDTVIALISIINAWDGAYELTGTMVDNVNPALTGVFPTEYHLVTAGPTSNIGFSPYYADYYVEILNAGAGSVYGAFVPVFEFDPATNKIISVVNGYGQPAGNTRSAELDPSGENMYFSDTRTIKVKFFMKQPSVVPAAPNIRTSFDWTLKYIGPR
ncbi:hypothetical protein BH10BAC3_BH10BAC3_33170 [soil metagenome]